MSKPGIPPRSPRRQKKCESSAPPARSSAHADDSFLRNVFLRQNENVVPACAQTGAPGSNPPVQTAARFRPTAAPTPELPRQTPPPACTRRPAHHYIADLSAVTTCAQQNIHRLNSPPPPLAPAQPPAPSVLSDPAQSLV